MATIFANEYPNQDFSDYGSVAASVVDQMPIEDLLRQHARKTTLDLLRANGIQHEDDLLEISENQLFQMGVSVVERRKVLARTDSLRRRKRRMTAVRERIPDDSCRASHQRASKLFLDASFDATEISTNPFGRLRYSTYGPIHFPARSPDPEDMSQSSPKPTSRRDSAVKRTSSVPTAKPRRHEKSIKKMVSESDKYLETKSLDSVGDTFTDGESIMTLDEPDGPLSSTMNGTTPDFASTVPLVSATPVEPEKPPRIVQREPSMKLALETKPFATGRSHPKPSKSPLTPRHVAASLKLMSIWHAHYVLNCKANASGSSDNVGIKELRRLVRLVSEYSREKSPTKVLNELDRQKSLNKKFGFRDLQKMLVDMYSNNPLAIDSDGLETEVWSEFYLDQVKNLAADLGCSLTVCFLLWQVFNRLADEQFYPPAMPKFDMQKVLQKCSKFFDRPAPKFTIRDEDEFEPVRFPEMMKILWGESKDERFNNGRDPSLEMAKELNTVFVTEELRAGTLSKRVNAFKWNKRYFSVVPFELRWWSNSKKEGTPRTFPLNENTKLVQKETKIEIINGDKRIRLKGKDAKSVMKWNTAIGLVYRAYSTTLTPRQSQLMERRYGEGQSLEATFHV